MHDNLVFVIKESSGSTVRELNGYLVAAGYRSNVVMNYVHLASKVRGTVKPTLGHVVVDEQRPVPTLVVSQLPGLDRLGHDDGAAGIRLHVRTVDRADVT